LEQAEEFARSLDARVMAEGDHIRPELLRREDAIVVLWRELQKVRSYGYDDDKNDARVGQAR
jgi:hypothetical protein